MARRWDRLQENTGLSSKWIIPLALAALEKSGNLNQALRVNPIAGDINIWKRKLDQRLNTLQDRVTKYNRTADIKGLRALNEVNQTLFGKGAPLIHRRCGGYF